MEGLIGDTDVSECAPDTLGECWEEGDFMEDVRDSAEPVPTPR
jgi:hypothetical protein